jgi:hypothetical protein
VLLSTCTITIDTPGSEMMRMLGTIIQAELGNVPTSLASMSLVETRLAYLSERMTRPDAVAMVPTERVDLLVTEHAEAQERRNAAPRVTPSDEDSLVGGYVRAYDQALRVNLNSNVFRAIDLALSTTIRRKQPSVVNHHPNLPELRDYSPPPV